MRRLKMKRIKICSIVLIILLLSGTSFALNIPEFGLGCATSFISHELGHYIVGNSTGKLWFEMRNGLPYWYYDGDELFETASAGFATDLMMREYYLQKKPEGDFWKGIFWYSILHHILYCFNDSGDVSAMHEASGIEIGTIHSVLAILTVLDIYRYMNNDNSILSITPKGLAIGYTICF